MRSKLFKSGMIFTVGNLLIQGLAFITLPIYTRIISPEVYGQFNLYMAWISLFSLFIGLQTAGSLSSARVQYPEAEYQRYAVSAFTLSNIFFVTVLLVTILIQDKLSMVLDLTPPLTLALVVQSYCQYVVNFWGQYFIQHQKATVTLYFSAFSAILNTILSILLIYWMEDDFLARVIGNFVPSLLVALVAIYFLYSRREPLLDRKYIHFILAVSLPLIFHNVGHQLLNQLDRIMLGKMMTTKEVALYSFGYNVGLVIQIVLGSVNTAWVPWFFDARKKKLPHLQQVITQYLSIGLFLTLGYLTIFPELSLLLGGTAYQYGNNFIALIVVSYFFVFLYTFPVNIQFYYADTRMIPLGTLLAAGLNFVLNLVLIPNFGINGAAYATLISYFFLLLLHHLVSKKKYGYQDVSEKTYVVLVTVSFLYAIMMTAFSQWLWLRWSIGLIILFAYAYYYRSYIIAFIRKR